MIGRWGVSLCIVMVILMSPAFPWPPNDPSYVTVGPLANYPDSNLAGYMAGWYLYHGIPLPFRLMYPKNYNPSQSYPLIFTVHGSGETGTNNYAQVSNAWNLPYLLNPSNTQYYSDFPCFVLAPQVPGGGSSGYFQFLPTEARQKYTQYGANAVINPLNKPGYSFYRSYVYELTAEREWFVDATASLLLDLLANNATFYNTSDCTNALSHQSIHIDTGRVYFAGFSLGGFYAFRFAEKLPDKLAGIVVLDGGAMGYAYTPVTEPLWIERLQKEVDRYRHIPFLLVSGASNLWMNVIDCYYKLRAGGDNVSWVTNGGGHGWPLVQAAMGSPLNYGPVNGKTIWAHTFDANAPDCTTFVQEFVGDARIPGRVRGIDWLFAQNRGNNPVPGDDPYPDGEYNFPKKILRASGTFVCNNDFVRIRFDKNSNDTATLVFKGISIPVGDRNGKLVWNINTTGEHEYTGPNQAFVADSGQGFPIIVTYEGLTGAKDSHNFTADAPTTLNPNATLSLEPLHVSFRFTGDEGQAGLLTAGTPPQVQRQIPVGVKNGQLAWRYNKSDEHLFAPSGEIYEPTIGVSIPGDVNFDGYVTFADETVVTSNLGKGPGMGFSQGDLNDDGYVTPDDLQIVQACLGTQGDRYDYLATVRYLGKAGSPPQHMLAVDITRHVYSRKAAPVPTLVAAVSRKAHGVVGDFDINLPLVSPYGIECRLDGPTRLILTFDQNLQTGQLVAVTLSSGTVTSISISGDQLTIDLSGVADQTWLTVAVAGLQAVGGNTYGNCSLTLGVFCADVNSSGSIDATDVALIEEHSEAAADNATFRYDLNCSGMITATDIVLAKSRVLNILPPTLTAAVSRKTHGAAGDFDINLPLGSPYGIECRSNGPTRLILTFNRDIQAGTNFGVTASSGMVNSTLISGKQLTISLSGVTDQQWLNIAVTGVRGMDGGDAGSYNVTVGVLCGDIDSSKAVNTGDIMRVDGQSAVPVNATTFRCDVNASGRISSTDIVLVKSKGNNYLP